MKSIVNKPWGSYQIIDQGENFIVKNIVVKPYVNFLCKAISIDQSIG